MRESLLLFFVTLLTFTLIEPIARSSPTPTQALLPSPIVTENQTHLNHKHHWMAGFGMTTAWVSPKHRQLRVANNSNNSPPNDVDEYTVSNKNFAYGANLFFGYRWLLHHKYLKSVVLGLRYQYLYTQNISGNIIQFSVPTQNNYHYKTVTPSHIVVLFSKLEPLKWGRFSPFFALNFGLSVNTFDGYTELSNPGTTTRVSPHYNQKSQMRLAYGVGFGIDYAIQNSLILSIEYTYMSLGHLTSGFAQTSAWSNQRLEFGDLYANMVSLNVSTII